MDWTSEQNLNAAPTHVVTPTTTKSKFKVLVVEDDKSQWPMWENILTSIDKNVELEVDWTTTAEDAQKLICQAFSKELPYDLVVSDVYLEGSGTGLDLWNRYGEATHNFIFVSGAALNQNEILKNLDFGSPVFLKKPISVERCKTILKLICNDHIKGGGGQYEQN